MCLSGVRAELEARDRDVIEMPLFSDVRDMGDDTDTEPRGRSVHRRPTGAESQRRTVRCIVRADEDGELVVASIRFGPELDA